MRHTCCFKAALRAVSTLIALAGFGCLALRASACRVSCAGVPFWGQRSVCLTGVKWLGGVQRRSCV
eukprot:9113604-Alexandrium_andersonii.AAC.1